MELTANAKINLTLDILRKREDGYHDLQMVMQADEAINLINSKREAESKKVVKVFDEEPDMQILNGRYGMYICYNKANYKIPKSVTDPAALTLEECRQIVESQPDAAKKTSRRKTTKK